MALQLQGVCRDLQWSCSDKSPANFVRFARLSARRVGQSPPFLLDLLLLPFFLRARLLVTHLSNLTTGFIPQEVSLDL